MNLENRMTVCMGYQAMTPKCESRKTPLERGRKSMQRERRKNNDILFHFRKDDLPMTKLTRSSRNKSTLRRLRKPTNWK